MLPAAPYCPNLRAMGRRGFHIVGIAALGLVLALLVASTSSTSFLGPVRTGPSHRPRVPSSSGSIPVSHGRDQTGMPTWFTVTATIFLALIVAALLLLIVTFRWRHDDEDEPLLHLAGDADEPTDDWQSQLTVDLAAAVDEQLTALRQGPPRDAIIACWMRLQAATRVAGMSDDASETAVEFTVRAMGSLEIDNEAITTLSELYREARFSDHAMSEQQRELAAQALLGVSAQLAVARVTR